MNRQKQEVEPTFDVLSGQDTVQESMNVRQPEAYINSLPPALKMNPASKINSPIQTAGTLFGIQGDRERLNSVDHAKLRALESKFPNHNLGFHASNISANVNTAGQYEGTVLYSKEDIAKKGHHPVTDDQYRTIEQMSKEQIFKQEIADESLTSKMLSQIGKNKKVLRFTKTFSYSTVMGNDAIQLPETTFNRVFGDSAFIVTEVRLNFASSTCPTEIGLSLPFSDGNVFSVVEGNGAKAYSLILGPNEKIDHRTNPNRPVLYNRQIGASDFHSTATFGHLDIGQIKQTLQPISPQVYSVPENSIIMKIIKENEEKWKIDNRNEQRPSLGGRFFVLKEIVDLICDTLQAKIEKSKPPTSDFFTVEFKRADGKLWNDPMGIEDYDSDSQVREYLLSKQCEISVELEVSYIPTNPHDPTRK